MGDISKVRVTFIDGEVKEYTITASPFIGRWLAEEAGRTGMLTLFNRTSAWTIPIENIREYAIEDIDDGDAD
jgi:hypothetical protein